MKHCHALLSHSIMLYRITHLNVVFQSNKIICVTRITFSIVLICSFSASPCREKGWGDKTYEILQRVFTFDTDMYKPVKECSDEFDRINMVNDITNIQECIDHTTKTCCWANEICNAIHIPSHLSVVLYHLFLNATNSKLNNSSYNTMCIIYKAVKLLLWAWLYNWNGIGLSKLLSWYPRWLSTHTKEYASLLVLRNWLNELLVFRIYTLPLQILAYLLLKIHISNLM